MPVATEAEPELPALIDLPDLAERFNVTPRTVRRWIAEGTIPSPIMLGRRAVWTAATIRRFLDGDHPPGDPR
jgi:predicted DNA-binding transcriptional regulator AlpA